MEDFSGYVVRRALGSGSAGSVWLARDHASGRPVVLKRVPLSAARERFRRDLALAQGLDHLHIARLLEVRQGEREWVLISEYGAAGTLASLLERRPVFSLGELVTLIGPVAQALAAAHRAGLTHSHLGLGDIVLTADGRPLVTDLGLRSVTGERDAAADLADLAELAIAAGGDPRVFSADLFDADAYTVAHRVLALANPAPINLALSNNQGVDAPVLPAPRPHKPRLPGVLAAITLAVAIVLAVAAFALNHLATPSTTTTDPPVPPPTTTQPPITHPTPTPSPTITPTAPPTAVPTGVHEARAAAWLATLRALDLRRSSAFATVDAHKLDSVYVPGSAPWRSDRAVLASYRTRGLRVLGLHIHINRITVTRSAQRHAVLQVHERLTSGTVVDESGHHTRLPPGPPTTRLITLARASPITPWRITHITTP